MRNSWFPRHKAEYMTVQTSQGLKPQRIVAERDFTFGLQPEEEESPKKDLEKEKVIEVHTQLLTVDLFWHSLRHYED